MNKIPFIAFGNDELGVPLRKGDLIDCPLCARIHPIPCSKDAVTGKETNIVLFYKCGKKTYLAGIDGRSILHRARND